MVVVACLLAIKLRCRPRQKPGLAVTAYFGARLGDSQKVKRIINIGKWSTLPRTPVITCLIVNKIPGLVRRLSFLPAAATKIQI